MKVQIYYMIHQEPDGYHAYQFSLLPNSLPFFWEYSNGLDTVAESVEQYLGLKEGMYEMVQVAVPKETFCENS